ncbi:rho GTPase-activating protein 11A-like [Spodoptera litura]|uniref:Rho GTPase-activating protein 11A-like n=1 Tax=Spodoptera litura TaxID=69820 RepID=A0A9J7DTS4_SPOLT|nr:rho GTPase-activating protein 11A-like [Spodoptera litura]
MLISDGINHGKLQSIIVGELKKAGLKHRLKKIILKSVKDHKTVFGAPLVKVPSCSVICCGSTLSVPIVVTEMSSVLRSNAHVEGLFRKAGSQNRQKDIKRLLDAGGCVSEGHHPIDVASVLKLYLRCLPEPLISAEVQDLLLRCRLTAGEDALKPILHTLLLLPVLHVHLLHYIMELLNFLASKHKDNLMDSSNLAIVMAPSIMPLPAAASAQRLEHHVALVKMFIENSQHIGKLTEELMSQLDDDSDGYLARRKKKRRSGSLNRVLSGLRKMVSGSVNTPATVNENGKTPVLSKSAAKRKFDSYEGLSAKTKKDITKNLPQKELSFTPMKMGLERKRLRLSLMDARSTPIINRDFSSHKNSETSVSSEDLLTSSEHLFSAHDTIDLSPDMKQLDKDYVRISKQEYEEIKSRVSAIENRLSREFTDVIPRVQPLQQVQNVYEQTLEEVAMLNCPSSDHLARRLSKELKIRPNEEAKIIRSPSARKIGSIRRRSKENITKIVRHKSWNVSSQSQSSHNTDRFYPYVGLNRRERTSTAKPDLETQKSSTEWDGSMSGHSANNVSDLSQKYRLRKRSSLIIPPDYSSEKPISRIPARRSLNITVNNSWDNTASENSMNNTLNSSGKSNNSDLAQCYQNVTCRRKPSPPQSQQKWRSAAAFFMDKTGELEKTSQTGRPSVNKLRRQNAGAVLAKAKLFESSSDKSSEKHEKVAHTGFARKPRISGQQNKPLKNVALVKPKIQSPIASPSIPVRVTRNIEIPNVPSKSYRLNVPSNDDVSNWRNARKTTPPVKNVVSPRSMLMKTPQIPVLKKPLCTPKSSRLPALNNDLRKANTPMKAVHISPRRRSPRQKQRV